ncbi:MAG: class B sortase [Clostridia bacterium]|nr:class B sortase [Clostridia bacterium]
MAFENNNLFEQSIKSFSSSDITVSKRENKRKAILDIAVRCLLIAVCLSVFAYSVTMLVQNSLETDEVNELYESVRPENVISAVKPSTVLPEPSPMFTMKEMFDSGDEYLHYNGDIVSVEDQQRRSAYYRNYIKFKNKYSDAYAWLYVNHTKIDYPVMKGEYTDYYLYRNFTGASSSSGCVTAESNMSDDYDSNLNNVFYGHCMKNGTMFRTLKTFMESANRNTLVKTMNIEVYTEDGLYIYKVLSGYRNDQNFFSKTKFSSQESFVSYLDKITSLNRLAVKNKYNTDSKICTLITCANVSSNEEERYVLHGVLVEFIPASNL